MRFLGDAMHAFFTLSDVSRRPLGTFGFFRLRGLLDLLFHQLLCGRLVFALTLDGLGFRRPVVVSRLSLGFSPCFCLATFSFGSFSLTLFE